MPWLLYRLIFGDLLRLIGITAAVLVTVIAFGATIKPLASDALLDAWQTFKYLGLAIVPMLQFALPFAAGFGATLAMHRMTADNEIQAMALSGLGYRRILLPLAALGLALTIVMVSLTQWIIPRFWSRIEQTVTSDITQLFQASIRRGQAFKLGDLQIYARDIIVQNSPLGPEGPETRMHLIKVAAAELDDQDRIITDVTAAQAVVDVYRRDDRTLLKLIMEDTVAFNGATGDLGRVARIEPKRAILIPNSLRDNPKAMTRGQLLELRRDPDKFAQVIEAKSMLADAIRTFEARDAVDAQLRAQGKVELTAESPTPAGAARTYLITADRMHDDQFLRREGRAIEIVQFENGAALRRFTADTAELLPAVGSTLGAPAFDLLLGPHEVTDLRVGGATNQRTRLSIPNLAVAGVAPENLAERSSAGLREYVRAMPNGPTRLDNHLEKLDNEIADLQNEITSRLMSRYALSITAFLLLTLGGTLAMWLRGSLPLTIYLWAFLPAIVDLIVISAGEQMLRDGQLAGAAVMWSGNALLLGLLLFAFLKLARN